MNPNTDTGSSSSTSPLARIRRGVIALAAAGVIAFTPLVAAPAAAASAPGVHLPGAIGQKWLQNKKTLGAPVTAETCKKGACQQQFKSGTIVWSAGTGAHILQGENLSIFKKTGGATGGLGLATTDRRGGLAENGAWQGYQSGGVFTHPTFGTHYVRSGMWNTWSQYNREWGILGYPKTDEYLNAQGVVRQDFQRGTVYWYRDGGRPVWQAIAATYRANGEELGAFGYPVGAERGIAGGSMQDFERASVYWSEKTGAQPVVSGFRSEYKARGAERSELGYPTGSETPVNGGSTQRFSGGALYWAASNGAVSSVAGATLARYDKAGGPSSALGMPVENKIAFSGGYYQRFEHGAITWAAHTGAKVIDAQTFSTWRANSSSFGWPTSDSWSDQRGTHTIFESGERIVKNGELYSAEAINAKTAILICDSQCDNNSWVEQGVRANGYTTFERWYGGGGFSAGAPALGMSVPDALERGKVVLPEGNPGLIVVTLGGNDASQGFSSKTIRSSEDRIIAQLQRMYPNTRIVVNGVMSRADAEHKHRREIDKVITTEAARLGLITVSVAGWGSKDNAQYKDGVHLTQTGHNTIAPHYADALKAALNK